MSTPSNVLTVAINPICYCSPSYSDSCNYSNKITTVSIGSYNDPLGASTCNQTSVPTVQLQVNTAPSVTVGTGGYVGVSASLDQGIDGNLTDAGDIFYPATYTVGSATYTFNLPNISTAGTYRLRIWCANANSGSGSSANFLPCDQYIYGNFRDYDLVYSYPLAVTLSNIKARNDGKANIVNWSIERSDKGDAVELQRSSDNKAFITLAKLNISPEQRNYSYNDEQPANGINYYRLKLNDASGNFTYSKVVHAAVNRQNEITVTPNPAKDYIHIQGNNLNDAKIEVVNSTGQVVKKKSGASEGIDISQLSRGIYYLKLFTGEEVQTIKFIKE